MRTTAIAALTLAASGLLLAGCNNEQPPAPQPPAQQSAPADPAAPPAPAPDPAAPAQPAPGN
jgi:hypothetical protein